MDARMKKKTRQILILYAEALEREIGKEVRKNVKMFVEICEMKKKLRKPGFSLN